MRRNRGLVIEFGYRGHQSEYLGHLVNAWGSMRSENALIDFLVTGRFARHHPDVAERLRASSNTGLSLHVLDPAAEDKLVRATALKVVPVSWLRPPGPPPNSAPGISWRLAQGIAAKIDATQLFFMEIDKFLPVLAARKASHAPLSGILFRAPVVESDAPANWKRWAVHSRSILIAALNHPSLKTVLCLDPRLPAEAWAKPYASKLMWLPDPLIAHPPLLTSFEQDRLRDLLGIPHNHTVALHFGQISERKNLRKLFAAVGRLPQDLRKRFTLLLFGPRVTCETPTLEQDVESLRANGVNIVWKDCFVSESFAQMLFKSADFVTAIYSDHVGMSGVVLRSAAAALPVIVDQRGLVASLVTKHGLGVCVDGEDVEAISSVLAAAIREPPSVRRGAASFLQQHDPARFTSLIFGELF